MAIVIVLLNAFVLVRYLGVDATPFQWEAFANPYEPGITLHLEVRGGGGNVP